MIRNRIRDIKRYCSNYEQIENYEQAINDSTQTWDCHHRGEVLPCGTYSRDTLKKFGLYYHRNASELLFIPHSEHTKLHSSVRHPTSITRKKLSESKKGDKNPNFGKHPSEETLRKMSASLKGKNAGKRFNDVWNHIEEVLILHRQGLLGKDIAKRFGCSQSLLSNIIHKYG